MPEKSRLRRSTIKVLLNLGVVRSYEAVERRLQPRKDDIIQGLIRLREATPSDSALTQLWQLSKTCST